MVTKKECLFLFYLLFFLFFSETDLRPYVDSYFDFKIEKPEDPIVYPWQCASKLTVDTCPENDFKSKFVSKAEYAEYGSNNCRNKFSSYFDNLL